MVASVSSDQIREKRCFFVPKTVYFQEFLFVSTLFFVSNGRNVSGVFAADVLKYGSGATCHPDVVVR